MTSTVVATWLVCWMKFVCARMFAVSWATWYTVVPVPAPKGPAPMTWKTPEWMTPDR